MHAITKLKEISINITNFEFASKITRIETEIFGFINEQLD